MKKENPSIYDQTVMEFVTVAAEYCAYLERTRNTERAAFVDRILKILSLLYLKVSLLSRFKIISDEFPERYVTEEMYESLRARLADILSEKDDYLEVFLPDMVYSDQPIKKEISEDLADIYQDIRDFIFVFQLGMQEIMNDALATCQENFKTNWGQKLVNTMRALHDIKYNQNAEEEGEFEWNECE